MLRIFTAGPSPVSTTRERAASGVVAARVESAAIDLVALQERMEKAEAEYTDRADRLKSFIRRCTPEQRSIIRAYFRLQHEGQPLPTDPILFKMKHVLYISELEKRYARKADRDNEKIRERMALAQAIKEE